MGIETEIVKLVEKAIEAEGETRSEPGEYPVRATVTIDIDGIVKVGNDYEQRIVAKADPWALYAAALGALNRMESVAGAIQTTPAALVALVDAADPGAAKRAKTDADAAIQAVKAATVTACKGKVTAKLGASHVTVARHG